MDSQSFRKQLRKNQTPAETVFWNLVRAKRFASYKFRRQHTIGKYTVDFYCAKLNLVVELDGGIHDNLGQSLYDEERDQLIKLQGYTVIRLENNAVLNHPENGINYLMEIIHHKED
jgi:very-short-patch-repair endonuclease